MLTLSLLIFFTFLIWWMFIRKAGFCERCTKNLSVFNAFTDAKKIGNKILCKKCQGPSSRVPAKGIAPIICESCKKNLLGQELKEAYRIDEPLKGYICESCVQKGMDISKTYHEKKIHNAHAQQIRPKGKEISIEESGDSFSDANAEYVIKLRKRLWIRYQDEHFEESERKIDVYYSKFGYFFGWCHLRNEPRTFKLSNVHEWKILNEKYEWKEDVAMNILKKAFD